MIVLRCILCGILATVLGSMLVFAQDVPVPEATPPAEAPAVSDIPAAPAAPAAPTVKKKVVYREKSYYEFEDAIVEGDKAGPDGASVFRKDRVKFKSSLNLSRSFMPEIKSSSQDSR